MSTPDERDTVGVTSPLHLASQFNALPEQEKKQVFSEGLGVNLLRSGLEFIVPLWWLFESPDDGFALRNGSAFLVDFGQGCFAVSAAHVYRGYLDAKTVASTFGGCQLGNILFDLEARLIHCRDDLDIATFRVDASEVAQLGKAVVTSDIRNWNSLGPAPGNLAFFGGFPAQTRGMTPDNNFATAPYSAITPITSVTDHQITCRFDRNKMIDFSGSGLPPQGYDVGGVSGGPLLVPTLTDEGLIWRFAGVIVQAAMGEMFEQVVAVRSQYVQLDGRIG